MRSTSRALVITACLLVGACSASAYEEPPYEVLERFGDVEVRRYAPYVVAETTVDGSFKGARNEAFRRLFGFISGQNTRREKIAMTVPVNQSSGRQAKGEKIAMTVPVFSNAAGSGEPEDGDPWTMEFVMPPGVSLDALPVPRDERVRLREVPQHTVAAYRYAGSTGERRFEEHAERLVEALAARGLGMLSDPVQAVYNGPFTIGPLRRNEVLVRVGLDQDEASSRPAPPTPGF